MEQYNMHEIVRKYTEGLIHPYAVDAAGEMDAWEYGDGYILAPWGDGKYIFVSTLPESFE